MHRPRLRAQLSPPKKGGFTKTKILSTAALALFLSTTAAFAGATKTYQVTGPVLEVKDDVVVVQKGKEKWEIARTPETKITGDLKVGSKVTIEYRMTATAVEVKGGDKPAKGGDKQAK